MEKFAEFTERFTEANFPFARLFLAVSVIDAACIVAYLFFFRTDSTDYRYF